MCKSKHLHEHLPHLRRRRPRGLWELRGAAETKQEIADARVEQLSLENLRAGLWHMPYISCVFQCMQNYRLFRNYCWRHSFLPPNRFCMFHHFSHVAYVCRFWNGEKKQRNGEKNPTKRRNKLRTQNVETETAKKTANSENLGNRR